jgi:hypothetical protein
MKSSSRTPTGAPATQGERDLVFSVGTIASFFPERNDRVYADGALRRNYGCGERSS